MGAAHAHAKAEQAVTARPPTSAPALVRDSPEREPEAPTTRDRMEAAFAGTPEWTTRERIARRAHVEEPEPQAPEPEPEEAEAEPEPITRRLRLVEPIDDAPEGSAPMRTVEPIARGPPLAAVVQTKLTVSRPGDAFEREADGVAARVLRGAPARPGPPRGSVPIRGPPSPTPGLPRSVASVVVAPGGGRPLDASVRERIEPHVGIDLGQVRVRDGPDAAAAAHDLHARAFTSGSTIFLAAGSSPADLALMAHEATHVAQQQTVAAARSTLMRDVTDVLPDISVDDVIPDWILDGVRETVRAIPGYVVLTYIAGRDPLSDEPAPASPQAVIEALLTRGPFGAAVGAVLESIDVLGEIFQFVMDGLAAHDLTLARVQRDIESAWSELSVTNGIAGNVAIVQRYVDALVRDVDAFVDSIVERVLEIVRAVVADVLEPLLATDAIAPLWNLVRKVLRYDPLRGVPVEAPTAEIIADFLRLIGEDERLAQMQERGTLQSTADWLDTQLGTFASLATELGTLFEDARAAIQPQNLPDLLTNLEALSWRAFGFIQGVGLFVGTLILKVLELIKESLLAWLSENAHSIPGFHLLTVIIGRNPFTGEEVPLTAETLIRGFITLLPGGAATYEQLAESGVISSAAERIEGEMRRLGITLELVTGTFRGIWDTLTLDDLLAPVDAFARILAQFGEPLARLIEFVAVVIEVVVTLILRLMNFPSELLGSVISNTLAAIDDIRRDPVGFLLNMVEAIKLGFTAFFDNIGRYLLDGLVAWLFRGLGQLGITLPTDFSLASVLTLVFQVLGLTIEHLWEKLGEHIGPERVQMIRDALDTLTGAWAFIQDVQREGLPAIWRYLKDQLSGIWTTLLGMATEWIMQVIIVSATVKLLSFIDPSGIMATINTCIAIFNAIMSAIEYMHDMLEVFNQYVATLAAVAAGNIVPGAQMLELGLASIIPIAIGFLAKQVGIGNIPEKITELIGRLRELIDEAIDWLIEQALRLGRAALDALTAGPAQQPAEAPAEQPPPEARTEEPVPAPDGELTVARPLTMVTTGHTLTVDIVDGFPQVTMASPRGQFLETAVASALYREEHGANRPDVVASLDWAWRTIKGLNEDWAAASSRSEADRRATISRFLSTMADVLEGLGRQFNIPDLETLGHASLYVEGKTLKPEYAAEVREWFYPSSYWTTTITWRDNRVLALTDPADPTRFFDEMTGASEPKSEKSIDHIYRVAEHWNAEGNRLRQDPRAVFYNDTSQTQVVARRNNSTDGALARALGLRYQPTVGTDFRGPDDNP